VDINPKKGNLHPIAHPPRVPRAWEGQGLGHRRRIRDQGGKNGETGAKTEEENPRGLVAQEKTSRGGSGKGAPGGCPLHSVPVREGSCQRAQRGVKMGRIYELWLRGAA